MSMMYVAKGDITTAVEVEAIATAINPEGQWFGQIDSALIRTAGDQYHRQATEVRERVGLYDGQTVVAPGRRAHPGSFHDVIFVVDALKSPLGKLIQRVLLTAQQKHYRSLALPLMRTGAVLGKVEKNAIEVVDQILNAWREFDSQPPHSTMDIYLVVHHNEIAYRYLTRYLPCTR